LRYKKGLNNKLIRIRREIYRKFVSDLAKKYSICGIEDFDLRQVTTKIRLTCSLNGSAQQPESRPCDSCCPNG
jgi:carbamoylphosphate synthase small subunit